jgi:hypothetical protein
MHAGRQASEREKNSFMQRTKLTVPMARRYLYGVIVAGMLLALLFTSPSDAWSRKHHRSRVAAPRGLKRPSRSKRSRGTAQLRIAGSPSTGRSITSRAYRATAAVPEVRYSRVVAPISPRCGTKNPARANRIQRARNPFWTPITSVWLLRALEREAVERDWLTGQWLPFH